MMDNADTGAQLPQAIPAQRRRTSKLAVAALILAILPTCLTQLIAIALAIGALVAVRREKGLKGAGLAVAALIIAILLLLILPMILAFMFFLRFHRVPNRRHGAIREIEQAISTVQMGRPSSDFGCVSRTAWAASSSDGLSQESDGL